MLRAATGTPIRRTDLANMPLALADPEPFTLANLTTKSFTASRARTLFERAQGGLDYLLHAPSAWVMLRRNFCISHAPVGQRSAHRPQCRR